MPDSSFSILYLEQDWEDDPSAASRDCFYNPSICAIVLLQPKILSISILSVTLAMPSDFTNSRIGAGVGFKRRNPYRIPGRVKNYGTV
jgi:hypothetical protein